MHRGDTGLLGQSRLYALLADHGLYSKCQGFHKRPKPSAEYKHNNSEMKTDDIQLLRDFAIQVKSSTSFWYGGWIASFFRTQRKEKALDTIILELNKLLAAKNIFNEEINIQGDPREILRDIIYNAMIVRGSSGNNETSSRLKAVELLENDSFTKLKAFLPKTISYEALKGFSKEEEKNMLIPLTGLSIINFNEETRR